MLRCWRSCSYFLLHGVWRQCFGVVNSMRCFSVCAGMCVAALWRTLNPPQCGCICRTWTLKSGRSEFRPWYLFNVSEKAALPAAWLMQTAFRFPADSTKRRHNHVRIILAWLTVKKVQIKTYTERASCTFQNRARSVTIYEGCIFKKDKVA